MKTAKFLILIALVAALVAGCGGSSDSASLQSDDVAVVGDSHISKADYDALIAQAKRSFAQQTPPRKFPTQGTPEFQTIRGQAVTLLVQQAEREEKATSEGITITEKQIDARLAQIKKQYFQNSEAKYKAQLTKQHLTEDQVRKDIRAQLISEAVFKKVTNDVKIDDGEVHDYYIAHPQLYSKAQTRDVRHILVKSKAQRRPDLRAAEGRQHQDLVHPGEEVLAGPELEGQLRQADRLEGSDRRGVRQGRVLREDERDPRADPRRAVRLVRDRARLGRAPALDDAGEAGVVDDQAAAEAAEAEPGDDRLGQQPLEELLRRQEDQVPGRVHAVARSVHVDHVDEHLHLGPLSYVARGRARRAPGADRATPARVPLGP